MTLEEFLSHLSETDWKLVGSQSIRTKESFECPLVYVYNKLNNTEYANCNYYESAKDLGLNPKIALAADNRVHNPNDEEYELRKKLLQACRLEEVES